MNILILPNLLKCQYMNRLQLVEEDQLNFMFNHQ